MQLRSSLTLSLVLLPLLILFTRLGFWQLQRMHEKQGLIDRFEHAPEMSLPEAIASGSLFARVHVSGRYKLAWHLLLDNKILNGRAGVHVMSLFQPDHGLPILVNRGWLPLPEDRRNLPEIPTPSGQVSISGILSKPVEGGIRLGEADQLKTLTGPHLITYLDLGRLKSAMGGKLSPWLIQLDARDNTGFAGRDWKPTVMMPAQHRAYAVQWFGLAVAIAIIWLRLAWKWFHSSETTGKAAEGNESQVKS